MSSPAGTTASPTLRWCSFRLAHECFAVESDVVVEVMRCRRPTPVPLAARGVLGLVQIRGRIVPVVDPGELLGLPGRSLERGGTLLVITSGDDWYGLLVDEMLEVLDIPSGGVERPTGGPGLVVGSFAAPDRLVHLVDPERMIHSLTRQRPPVGGRTAVS